ncbi:MAG: SDR family NAD(P)-dependent oxidoreductase, partial [Hydrogenophaga sp.]|nr:SDR family NAD(P)-dependent oxidoreductase [Hydrogenophaga sp.]
MQLNSTVAAVITGGASGLGAATARRLAAHGVKVALFDLNAEQGEALAQELGGVFCPVDVTSEAQVDAGFAQARAAHGQERILVNCAGTGNAVKTASRDKTTGEIKHYPTANFDRIIQINL